MKQLFEAEPAWRPGTVLRVFAPNKLTHAPTYVWHEKRRDFEISGFVPKGTVVTFVRSWMCHHIRYAECNHNGAPLILLQASVEPADDDYLDHLTH